MFGRDRGVATSIAVLVNAIVEAVINEGIRYLENAVASILSAIQKTQVSIATQPSCLAFVRDTRNVVW
ncbi:unnamed protein product, partial [Trichogramma brassicae]